MRLSNKTILITGANRGIGRALAEEFTKHQVHLLLGMRSPKDYEPIDQGQAKSIKAIRLDLSSFENIQRDLKSAGEEIHGLDILVNNAGQFVAGPLENQDPMKVAAMVQVNLTGLMQLTAELLPILRKRQGKIVNNASIAGYAYFPLNATYSATKAGVVAFSEALRRELVSSGVGVLHLVTPGVATDMFKDVNATYQGKGVSGQLGSIPADTWAHKVIKAIETDRTMLSPGGATGVVRILSQALRFLLDIVSKQLVKN